MISSLGKPNGEGEGTMQYRMSGAVFVVWFCQCLVCINSTWKIVSLFLNLIH